MAGLIRGKLLFVLVSAFALAAQQADKMEGTRQLYYLATPSTDSLPPPPHSGSSPSTSGGSTSVMHLGIRYNLLLVRRGEKTQQISSDRVLSEGDCFAIELQSNRSGYLYVLARQSSGSWTPLTDMPGQREALPPAKSVRIPSKGNCFDIHNPPGVETLFVVLSREPQDFFELYSDVKERESAVPATRKSTDGETQMASAHKLDAAIAHLDEKFGGARDITIASVGEPERAGEPRGAVYVVSKKLSSSIVTKIQVRHQ